MATVAGTMRCASEEWQEAAALDESLAAARAIGYPYAEAKALYVSGLLYRERGEPTCARPYFEQALAILGRLGERLNAERIERELTAPAWAASLSGGLNCITGPISPCALTDLGHTIKHGIGS